MTKRIFLMALATATFACQANAAEVMNRVLLGAPALQLFSSIQDGDPSATGKTLELEDGSLSISCRQDQSQNTACAVAVDKETQSNGILVLNGANAKRLYTALNVAVLAETASDVKIFTDADENISILCARSIIPNGDPYACSVELSPN